MEKWEKNKSSLCSWSPTEISEEGFQWDSKKNHSNVLQSGPKKLTQWMTHTHNIWGCCGEEEGVAAITRGTRQWKAGSFFRWQVHGITANTSCSDSSWWIHRTLKKEKNSKGNAWYSGYKMRQAGTSGQGPPWISINPVFRALSTWDFLKAFPSFVSEEFCFHSLEVQFKCLTFPMKSSWLPQMWSLCSVPTKYFDKHLIMLCLVNTTYQSILGSEALFYSVLFLIVSA